MAKSIWKFPLYHTEVQGIQIPKGAEILCVQVQMGTPTIWAMVDPDADTENRTIYTVGTGSKMLDGSIEYIGTCQFDGGSLVYHFFEATT